MSILLAALLTLGYVFGAILIGADIFMLSDGCIEFVNICFILLHYLPTNKGTRC